ncbi:hypothetical protein NH340_JMT00215 [Sarcoptes scabiei]|nr:hypothetical protein NH340_JMT00215 [Sarcoptes scabiei]
MIRMIQMYSFYSTENSPHCIFVFKDRRMIEKVRMHLQTYLYYDFINVRLQYVYVRLCWIGGTQRDTPNDSNRIQRWNISHNLVPRFGFKSGDFGVLKFLNFFPLKLSFNFGFIFRFALSK